METQSVNEYERLVRDVCNIFRSVTNSESIPEREAGAIIPFAREFKWGNYEFRLLIEHHWNSAYEREFINKPGNCNLRTIFNSARKDRLRDLLADIVKMKQAKEKYQAQGPDDSGMKTFKFKCLCGNFIEKRYIKVCDESGRFSWQWCNPGDYEQHFTDALWSGGRCIWPDEYREKYYNNDYLSKLRDSKTNHMIFFEILKNLEKKIETVDPPTGMTKTVLRGDNGCP